MVEYNGVCYLGVQGGGLYACALQSIASCSIVATAVLWVFFPGILTPVPSTSLLEHRPLQPAMSTEEGNSPGETLLTGADIPDLV